MGFYGNITNTAKTTFSFDLVYESRFRMEEANKVNSDGVFLGRYVLVDYDTDVIEAYYTRPENSPNAKYMFYNIPLPDRSTKPLTPQIGVVYQTKNQNTENNLPHFYQWDPNYDAGDGSELGGYILISDGELTKYTIRFRDDVSYYGRGYDSTVWMKTYDDVSKSYKYVMIAELNAAVPTFHLINHPPTVVPTTPYFDRDTTNLDYYLNMASNYGFKLDSIEDEGNSNTLYSDQLIDREKITYTVDKTGYQSWTSSIEEDTKADIFYNKAGFESDAHTYIQDSQLANSIGYRLTESGRHYGSLPYVQPYTAADTFSWHLRLPVLGNAICEMWDRFYGNRFDNKRYLNFAKKREDNENNLVTYDQDTVIGIINTARDMLGYYYIPLSELNKQEGNVVGPEAIDTTVTHIVSYSKGDITDTEIKYPILQCLYYDDNNYYHYAYTPTYKKYDSELQDGVTYYYETAEGTYRVANPEARKYNDANNEEQTLQFWEKIDGWTLKKIIPDVTFENSIYGLITEIHKLLGTNVGDTRDYGSIQGSINIIKDIVESLELKPDRLVRTNEKGQLTTYDNTYFPSAIWDRDEVLDGNGNWVSRFATVKVLTNSENANQVAPEVNTIVDGAEQNVAKTIVSDNDKSNDGTSLVNSKKHTTNNLTLGTRNKWIQLHGNEDKDSIEFKHLESPIIGRLRAEQAIGTSDDSLPIYVNKDAADDNGNVTLKTKDELIAENADFDSFSVNENATEITVKPTTDNLEYKSNESDQNDNRLTIPYLTVDNAGHVVELGTKNFNIPHGFKKIKTTIIEDTVDGDSSDTPGTSIAESISDTLELAPQNRWIDIATIEDNDVEGSEIDKITFGHRLVPTLNTDVTLNGERRTKDTEIPTVYRYGLPANKTISDLDEPNGANEAANTFNVPYIEIDKAGHIVAAETHTVTLPENFEKVTLTTAKTEIEDSLASNDDSFNPTTLQDNITFKTHNRWIKANINTDVKSLSFAHEIVNLNDTVRVENNQEIKLNNVQNASVLHPSRLSDPDIVPTVYRFGLPQDKSIETLDKDNGTEKANTFNVPYIEVDKAGHVVAAATHTVTVPHGYSKILTGDPIDDEAGVGKAGHTIDNLAAKTSVLAETLEEEVIYTPSNKWIRINASNTEGQDTVTFGHEIHTIVDTAPPAEDLDSEALGDKTFTTQVVNWDEAGHIIEYGTKTWTLPNSIRNIHITGISTGIAEPAGTEDGTIKADYTSDTVNMSSANKWIRLTTENNDLTFGHLTQGTAGNYTGIDISFIPNGDTNPRFGESVTLYGYTTDEAGHVIGYPEYTLTLPMGSYEPDNDDTTYNGARVITGINFVPKTGEITSTSIDIDQLKLINYQPEATTKNHVIDNTLTIAKAFAVLDDRIDKEEQTRNSSISDLRMFKTVQVIGSEQVDATSNADTMVFDAGNDAIQINSKADTKTITISHAEQLNLPKQIGLYKITMDGYGHITSAVQATKSDIELSNVDNMSVDEIIESITSRFSMSLNQPILSTNTNENESGKIFTVNIENFDAKSQYEYKWTKNDDNLNWTDASYTVIAANEEPGTYKYKCEVTRTYAGVKSSSYKEFTYVKEPEQGEGTV